MGSRVQTDRAGGGATDPSGWSACISCRACRRVVLTIAVFLAFWYVYVYTLVNTDTAAIAPPPAGQETRQPAFPRGRSAVRAIPITLSAWQVASGSRNDQPARLGRDLLDLGQWAPLFYSRKDFWRVSAPASKESLKSEAHPHPSIGRQPAQPSTRLGLPTGGVVH